MSDMPRLINEHTFETFSDTWADPDFLTSGEKAIIELKTEIFGAFLDAREKRKNRYSKKSLQMRCLNV